MRDHARAKGHDLDDCFAYSDSYSDVPMLSVVGHPAAVNPDAKLARLAHTYSWPVVTLSKPAFAIPGRSSITSRLAGLLP